VITPAHVHIVPPEIQSDASLRAFLGFDDHAALYPQHELFVLWFRQDPRETYAVLMALPRTTDALGDDYWQKEWPLIVDPETRVVQFTGPRTVLAGEPRR
jgi:hypothetical protein